MYFVNPLTVNKCGTTEGSGKFACCHLALNSGFLAQASSALTTELQPTTSSQNASYNHLIYFGFICSCIIASCMLLQVLIYYKAVIYGS